VEKLEELAPKAHFSGKSHFGDLGSETFQIYFEESNNTFWFQTFARIAPPK
jgi:hypothetical protein